jgi:hypothetical protein
LGVRRAGAHDRVERHLLADVVDSGALVLDGHATVDQGAIAVSNIVVRLRGEAGLNVTAWPATSTAVHWALDGHTAALMLASSIPVCVGLPGDRGSNVTC